MISPSEMRDRQRRYNAALRHDLTYYGSRPSRLWYTPDGPATEISRAPKRSAKKGALQRRREV